MKKRQNTSRGATALRSTTSVMLLLVSAVLLSPAVTPPGNRVGHNGSERTDNVKTTPWWSPTGSLNVGRYSHTATLLPNGKVLVAGGFNSADSTGPLSSAELYDPEHETWSTTGSLHTGRFDHTATLLPNGKVLVAGGTNHGNTLSSTEMYDPTTGAWSSTGSMVSARYRHTATLLPSGKVLVVGGQSDNIHVVILSSAELYDPAAGTWTSTGSMAVTREDYTATLLSSGKVLAVGGHTLPGLLSSAELYDPATGTWSVTGSMNTARGFHTATLLSSGKVLVAAGSGGDFLILSSAELYDPDTGVWSSAGSLAVARAVHTATLLPSEKVLVTAGNHGDSLLSSAELYDPVTGIWSNAGSLDTERYFHTATLLPSGKVLVVGGSDNSDGYLSSAEVYEAECTLCHKRTTTLLLECGSDEYRRHLDHGDSIGACPAAKKDTAQTDSLGED